MTSDVVCAWMQEKENVNQKQRLNLSQMEACGCQVSWSISWWCVTQSVFTKCRFHGSTEGLRLSPPVWTAVVMILMWTPKTSKRDSGCNSELSGRLLSTFRACFILFANKTSLLFRNVCLPWTSMCPFWISSGGGQLCSSLSD